MLNSILLFKSSLTKGNNLVGVGGGCFKYLFVGIVFGFDISRFLL